MDLDTPRPQRHLLVADDDHDLVDSLCQWIVLSSNWTAVPAYGTAQAMAQAESSQPDVILMDMEMKGADAFELADRLERAAGSKHSAILVLTASAELRDAALRDPRFTASMLKPADPGLLVALLSSLESEH